ncbi:DUF2145 domain-containing protein [Legionella taurinensis]|uniref:DUF2145 domain-containing protein n=1 Tax=Legionella taurinensis TaxID=70611 RepID=A0AB38N6U6_9GAMM|nr:DUF2145 domain-containing protein [Legionella taurinensis]MDX1837236.1 DUF2145 domain-containing protein [Legionella taurinensis]PUT40291.1 DUF2145 domain-containing protein [Legionella taurinensis]PUT41525.1 DUF2145 domain-containing protein [Legionella taurinensis]PUT48353.1 DUF2145 domain-containing protein [Legionella taurinensis]TID35663.1 DUF2145 domain-containing protein [Legionella taurinensis]
MTKLAQLTAWLMFFGSTTSTLAGTVCKNDNATVDDFYNASRTSLAVSKTLDHSGAKVALLARVGSDLSRYGLRYSHVAFVVKDYPGQPGKWTVIHLLNECNRPTSSLYAQGLMNFFMDNLYSQEYQITIPDQRLQARLYEALKPTLIERLHSNQYSMIAYPYSSRYQNSNQWVLEMVADTDNPNARHTRQSAQDFLQRTGYQPSMVTITATARLGVSLTNAAIRFNDHPDIENRTHRYSIVSVDSVIAYLHRRGHLQVVQADTKRRIN